MRQEYYFTCGTCGHTLLAKEPPEVCPKCNIIDTWKADIDDLPYDAY